MQKIYSLSDVKKNIKLLPPEPGVYFFLDRKKEILYVGKAENLCKRIRSYFKTGGSDKISLLMKEARLLGIEKTNSAVDALIYESELIKKFQPKFNKLWRDDTNYFYVVFDKSEFPKLYVTHQPKKSDDAIGPFTDGTSLKKTLRLLRRIYQYCTCLKHHKRICLNYEMGFCFGWCCSELVPRSPTSKALYQKSLDALKLVLLGKSKALLQQLKKAITKFEKWKNSKAVEILVAELEALENILKYKEVTKLRAPDTTLKTLQGLQSLLGLKSLPTRIEVFDISSFAGKEAVGSMTVFVDGKISKNDFRKFRIKGNYTRDDHRMIFEVLKRRLVHQEWQYPAVALIDGGKMQLAAAKRAALGKKIKIISIAKPNKILHFDKKQVSLDKLPSELRNFILRLDKSAHNFAIKYHKTLREKELMG